MNGCLTSASLSNNCIWFAVPLWTLHYPGNLVGLPYSFLHLPGLVYQQDHLSGLLHHPGNLLGLPNTFLHLPGLVYHHLQPLESVCTSVQKMKIILLLLYFTWIWYLFEDLKLKFWLPVYPHSIFFFFLLLSNFSRGLLDVECCDNAALCCLREDEDAAGCRSESVTCLPAIQYIDIKKTCYIYFLTC